MKMIKNKFRNITEFSSQQVILVDVKNAIKDIKLNESSTGEILADIIKHCDSASKR